MAFESFRNLRETLLLKGKDYEGYDDTQAGKRRGDHARSLWAYRRLAS
jgi:hypothetical protein